jgi:protein-disulfide isomerase/uncharacterized membrane protein
MMGKARFVLVVLLVLAGASLSGLLWLQHHGEGEATALASQICGEELNPDTGCGAVNQSAYSEVRGIPLGAFGLFFYLSMALLLALGLSGGEGPRLRAGRIVFGLMAVALVFDALLFGVQAFTIHAYCKLCLTTYALNVAAIVLLWAARPGRGSEAAHLAGAAPDGRLVLAGWVLGSAALAAAVLFAEMVLDQREAQRAVSILGAPLAMSRAPATPAAPPSAPPQDGNSGFGAQSVHAAEITQPTPSQDPAKLQEELDKAKADAARLQEILDDPQKLQQYYQDKAFKEYDAAPVLSFDTTNTPVLGTPSAPVKVVEFSDILCPHCRQLAAAFDNYLPQAAGRVAVYFKNYPLDMACNSRIKRDVHPGACWLALGAICAQQQGRFEAYYKKAFDGQPPASPQQRDVVVLGTAVGLDGTALETCMNAAETKARLSAEIDEAGRGEVSGTPTLFINGKKLGNLQFFLPIVEREAQKLGMPPMQPPGQ